MHGDEVDFSRFSQKDNGCVRVEPGYGDPNLWC